MGVYTVIANHDRQEVIDPNNMGESQKAHEWAWMDDAFLGMLRTGRRWAGERVELVDDTEDERYRYVLDFYHHLTREQVAFDGLGLTVAELEEYKLAKWSE